MSLDQPDAFVKHHSATEDAFLGGRLTVAQPLKGFRAGLDSVLLGAAVAPGARTLLDLGAGVGVGSLVAMAHHQALSATLVERDPDTVTLARHNLEANGFAARAEVLALDVTVKGSLRKAAGLFTDAFASVIANPPFFDHGRGTRAEDAGRAGARHMPEAELDLWVKTAAASAAPGGAVIFIHVAESLPLLLAAFAARFGGLTVLPLSPRPGAPASRVLVRGIKGSKRPLELLAARPVHGAEGRQFHPEFDGIFRGTARLVW